MIIYWANSLFGEADRSFNERCIQTLRRRGFIVLCPQDKPFNGAEVHTDARVVFSADTAMIKECDALVACIDQETIDSGVACEIGIAWALGKRLVALYTDFRQYRSGEYRMYKNPYVIGCIFDKGIVTKSLEETITALLDVKYE